MPDGDYRYITYETLDDGMIARIMLDRVDTRNAQNRGLLVELNDAFLRAEADDTVRVVIFGGNGPMFSSGHDLGTPQAVEERMPGPNQHPSFLINGAHAPGHREPDAAGVALLLPEHAAVAEPAQDHHRPGARFGVRGRAHADVGVRPHRGGRGHGLRRCRGHASGDVRHRVLRAPVGVRSAQDQGAHAHQRLDRRRGVLPARHGEQDLPGRRAVRAHGRVRAPDLQDPDHGGAAHQGVGEPDPGQPGLLQLAAGVLHHARAEPRALGRRCTTTACRRRRSARTSPSGRAPSSSPPSATPSKRPSSWFVPGSRVQAGNRRRRSASVPCNWPRTRSERW